MHSDTIFALASGTVNRAGLSVYRLSGSRAGEILEKLTRQKLPEARKAKKSKFYDLASEVIDEGICLWFPMPASFTGEDVVELHLHGGIAVATAISQYLVSQGLRPAEPGEFSRRAFMAGKLDLTQAEAIADLVNAETAAQRRQAIRQLDGYLKRLYDEWRQNLIRIQASLEGSIDFADEEIPEDLLGRAGKEIKDLKEAIAFHLTDNRRGEKLREGLQVAIIGAPNVGKSSLLNRLAGRDVAIVSSRAGTTRDVIEVHLDLGDFPVCLSDTAGIRESVDEIEQEGVRRALSRAKSADILLILFDIEHFPDIDETMLSFIDDNAVVVINKCDKSKSKVLPDKLRTRLRERSCHFVSAMNGDGMDEFIAGLKQEAKERLSGGDGAVLSRARHRYALENAYQALSRASENIFPELIAEEIRLAARFLGRITGQVDIEDVLDVIFSEFCIGK